MAHLLCIETSTDLCSVSISQESEVLITKVIEEGKRHSAELTNIIKDSLDSANVLPDRLSAVAISDGPGSYTGLRVGASTAKGLCMALDIPLIAIPTLELIASQYSHHRFVLSTIDARRMEVYAAVYQDFKLVEDVHSLIWDKKTVEELENKYTDLLICGNGVDKAKDILACFPAISSIHTEPLANMMAPLAWRKYSDNSFVDIAYHSPFYFKRPNITAPKKLI